MKKIILVVFCTLLIGMAKSQSLPAPVRLRCDLLLNTATVSRSGLVAGESLENAIQQSNLYQFANLYNPHPVLSWELPAAINRINAWRILVASSANMLAQSKADYWDSKRTLSNSSRATYNGKKLMPGKIYYWKVQVWNDKNVPGAFSDIQSFYLAPGDAEPGFAHYPLQAEMQQPVRIVPKENGSYFLDFGKDALGQLTLHLTSTGNDSIWVSAGEAIKGENNIDPNPGQNIRFIKMPLLLKKGTHDYAIEWPVNAKRDARNPVKMPGYIGEVYPFRYVAIENYQGIITPRSVQRKMVFYPFDENASSFISNDTVLNQVWDLCKYSIKATSFTGYYVDGDRERIPYEADALINQLSHYAVDAEYSMARRSMVYLLFNPTWPTEWSLQNVPIAWYDYMYTGNDALLKKYYSELQKKMLLPLAGDNGLISTRTNKQTPDFLKSIHIVKAFDGKSDLKDIVDWPQRSAYVGAEKEYAGETDGFVYCNYNSVVNAWYYHNLVLMQKIALALNKPDDARMYAAKSSQVYQSFQEIFSNPQTGLVKDGDTTLHASLHGNMFALAFGLIPPDKKDNVQHFIKTRRMACSVYGAQFLLDGLYDAGLDDYALELLTSTAQRSWYNMIRVGSTISMEAWDKLYKPNLDLNHAWGAAPANLIVRKLMGVEPLTPGFENFRIKPQMGQLSFAALKTPTIKGAVWVSWKKNINNDRIELTIPGGTKAEVVLPFDSLKPHLIVDGKLSAVKPVDGLFTIQQLAPGKHVLLMR